jgi:Xaa-Pro dipeptidase
MFRKYALDRQRNTCLYGHINTDTRFVIPNTENRIGERCDAVRPKTAALRAQFNDRPLVCTKSGSVNWITGGLSEPIDLTASSDPVWAIESKYGRALVTSEIEAPRLSSDYDLESLGWDLIAVPWFEPDAPILAATKYCGVAADDLLSDSAEFGTNVLESIVRRRMVLSDAERADIRTLGVVAAHALETGVEAWRPGVTSDYEIASVISAELERHGAKAVCLIVGGDERLRNLRHPLARGAVPREAVMAVVVARCRGLHVAATRIAVTRDDDPILELTAQLEPVHRGVLEASRPGHTWGDATEALAKGYENIGQPGAWREHFQGGPIAYEQREFELAPGQTTSPYWDVECQANAAVAWNPSLRGGAKIKETYLVGEDGFELITTSGSWPMTTSEGGMQFSQVKVVQ